MRFRVWGLGFGVWGLGFGCTIEIGGSDRPAAAARSGRYGPDARTRTRHCTLLPRRRRRLKHARSRQAHLCRRMSAVHDTRCMLHITCHTSHVTRHTSHVTRHTSHVTHHTSHITHHTSHATPEQRCCASSGGDCREDHSSSRSPRHARLSQ